MSSERRFAAGGYLRDWIEGLRGGAQDPERGRGQAGNGSWQWAERVKKGEL